MIGGSNLREAPGLRRAGLMAADAKYCGVEFGWGYGGRIVRVLCQRPVAGFAIHVRVLAVFLLIEHVGVAGLAGLVPGEIDRPGRYFGQCIAAIVAVLSETLRHQKAPDHKEQEYPRNEHPC